MSRIDTVTLLKDDFSAGEISPKFHGRVKSPLYQAGVATMLNALPMSQGAFRRRPGTRYVDTLSTTGNAKVIPYYAADGTPYVVVLTNNLATFYKVSTHALAASSTVTLPYASADIPSIRHAEYNGQLWLFHGSYPPGYIKNAKSDGTGAWTFKQPTFTGPHSFSGAPTLQVKDACYSDDLQLFVAVNSAGTAPSGRIYTSIDGLTWSVQNYPSTSGYTETLYGVCWSSLLGLFVVVGYTPAGVGVCFTSPDGITWTSRTVPSHPWKSVAWSPYLGLFAAVGATGDLNCVMTSPDGITWTARTGAAANAWCDIVWAPEVHRFVAVSGAGEASAAMMSGDGITWSSGTTPTDCQWNAVCWSPAKLLFVAVGAKTGGNGAMTSPDGITWTENSSAIGTSGYAGWSVAWSPTLALFVATFIETPDSTQIYTSPDGTTWTLAATLTIYTECISWSDVLGVFCILPNGAQSTDVPMVSADGTNWTSPGPYGYYPQLGAFYGQRLVFAGLAAEPFAIFESQSPFPAGGYANLTDFDLGTALDNEGIYYVMSEPNSTGVRWLLPDLRLLVGTDRSTWQDSGAIPTPATFSLSPNAPFGSYAADAHRVINVVLHLAADQRSLRSLIYSLYHGKYFDGELSEPADHLFSRLAVEFDVMMHPEPMAWIRMSDGTLVAGTVRQEDQGFMIKAGAGFSQHTLGGSGTAQSIGVVHNTNYDELWIVVKRGSTLTLEYLYIDDINTTAVADSVYFDGCSTVTPSGTAVTGLPAAFDGDTVGVLADGALQSRKTQSSGGITLDLAASKAQVGLPYYSAVKLLRPEVPADGTSQGKEKRIEHAWIRVYNSLGGYIGPIPPSDTDAANGVFSPLDALLSARFGATEYGSTPGLYTGDFDVTEAKLVDTDGQLSIYAGDGLPLNVLAVMERFALEEVM